MSVCIYNGLSSFTCRLAAVFKCSVAWSQFDALRVPRTCKWLRASGRATTYDFKISTTIKTSAFAF